MKASLSVSIIHDMFLPFRVAKRSILVDLFKTISNYFHQVLFPYQRLEAIGGNLSHDFHSEVVIRLAGLQKETKILLLSRLCLLSVLTGGYVKQLGITRLIKLQLFS